MSKTRSNKLLSKYLLWFPALWWLSNTAGNKCYCFLLKLSKIYASFSTCLSSGLQVTCGIELEKLYLPSFGYKLKYKHKCSHGHIAYSWTSLTYPTPPPQKKKPKKPNNNPPKTKLKPLRTSTCCKGIFWLCVLLILQVGQFLFQ